MKEYLHKLRTSYLFKLNEVGDLLERVHNKEEVHENFHSSHQELNELEKELKDALETIKIQEININD